MQVLDDGCGRSGRLTITAAALVGKGSPSFTFLGVEYDATVGVAATIISLVLTVVLA